MNQSALLEALAVAALAWNRARLRRIEAAKRVPGWQHPQHAKASRALDDARKAEAQAKARLRKACAAADPVSLTIDVEASDVIEVVARQIPLHPSYAELKPEQCDFFDRQLMLGEDGA